MASNLLQIMDKDSYEAGDSLGLSKQATSYLGYSTLKREQETALLYFVEGNDIFVSLPTGFGKNLRYGLLPLIFDLKRFGNVGRRQSIVIVISL